MRPVGELYLGNAPGASGTYSLSGGSLSAAKEILGYSGSGSFTQSGGTHAVGGILVLRIQRRRRRILWPEGSGLLSATYEYVGLYEAAASRVGRKQFRVQFVPRSQR